MIVRQVGFAMASNRPASAAGKYAFRSAGRMVGALTLSNGLASISLDSTAKAKIDRARRTLRAMVALASPRSRRAVRNPSAADASIRRTSAAIAFGKCPAKSLEIVR
nr:hypothetical protein [Limnoglobus roseus]